MKICFLTQTANDISNYYKDFFCNRPFYFITFKSENTDAVAFVPKSSWSEGRNRLWEEVKGKYDYYVFMDDDLVFCNVKPFFKKFPKLGRIYTKLSKKNFADCFEESTSTHFFSNLEFYLNNYKPEVAAVSQLDGNLVNTLDYYFLNRKKFIRRAGFFDAQFTVLSNKAANKLLPYDTKISGWVSAQILIYLYSFQVFKRKAINIIELGVRNSHHVGVYVENYEGIEDCRKMIAAINESTKKSYNYIAGDENKGVDYLFGDKEILSQTIEPNLEENYELNFNQSLKGIELFFNKNMGF